MLATAWLLGIANPQSIKRLGHFLTADNISAGTPNGGRAYPALRRMNAEDEFFQALEDRDTAIMQMDATIMTQKKEIEDQKATLEEQKATLEEQKAALEEKKAALEEKDASLRAAVLALSKSGMNAEMIAKTLNIGEEKIQEILSN